MVNIDSVRRLLAIADASKDAYAVADVAGALLEGNPADLQAAAFYARALDSLRLSAAAHRLLNPSAAPVSGGIIPWASRARRFAANLSALEDRSTEASGLVRHAAEGLSRYELHAAADGNYQVLDTTKRLPKGWLGGLANHKATESIWQFDRAQTPTPGPLLFEGLGFGWLFLHFLRTTEKTIVDYSCPVYVVEGDPLALAMLLHMHDLPQVIQHPRVRWFVKESGKEALEACRDAVANEPMWTLPPQFVRCALHDQPALPAQEMIEGVARDRAKVRNELVAQATAHYAGKDGAYWHRRFEEAVTGGGPPLRVLAITSRYTTVLRHSVAEMQQAVLAAGHDMRVAIEPDDHSLEHPFLQMIVDFKPDLIFQISRLRHENPFIPEDVPFFCWDQDNLPCMRTAEARESLNALTYIAGHGAVHGLLNARWPSENAILCHAAGSTYRYSNRPAAAELLAQHACDFSYVSNASGAPEQLTETLAEMWREEPALRQMFRDAVARVHEGTDAGTTWGHDVLRNMIAAMAVERQVPLNDQQLEGMTFNLTTVADRYFRHATLEWVSAWCKAHGKSLRIYGRGWDAHPTLKEHAAGPAAPGEETRAIYQATKINLQLIETGFIHSRVLDGLAAGGFFLTRRVFNDGSLMAETHHHAAVRALELKRYTVNELDACRDEVLLKYWPPLREDWDRPWRPKYDEPIPGLHVWAKLPPATVVFPHFDEIAFRTREEFGAMAEKYLSDGVLRRERADDYRRIVVEKFSYDSRWKTFLDAIRKRLAMETAR